MLSSLALAVQGVGPEKADAGVIGCGTTVTTDITLTADLVDCPNNGLVVGADDITIDLNGHTIDGDEALTKTCGKDEICDDGIVNEGFDGVTVEHGTLREFALGTLAIETKGATFRNLKVRHNMFLGMVVGGAGKSTLKKIEISGNGLETDNAGLGIFESARTLVARNVIRANGDIGIFTPDSERTRIVRNKISGHPEAGVLGGGNQTLIARNRLARNGDGIAWGGNDNAIRRNRVVRAKGCDEGCGIGIQLEAGKRNIIVGNTIRHPRRVGLRIAGYGPIADAVVARNRIRDAGKDGIAVVSVFEPVKRVDLRGNRASGSGDDGIDVDVRSVTLTRNVARRNREHGISVVEGVTDGGGNRASGNGSEQCKNIVCA